MSSCTERPGASNGISFRLKHSRLGVQAQDHLALEKVAIIASWLLNVTGIFQDQCPVTEISTAARSPTLVNDLNINIWRCQQINWNFMECPESQMTVHANYIIWTDDQRQIRCLFFSLMRPYIGVQLHRRAPKWNHCKYGKSAFSPTFWIFAIFLVMEQELDWPCPHWIGAEHMTLWKIFQKEGKMEWVQKRGPEA